MKKKFHLDESGTLVTLLIWDTAGQEKFRSIVKSFYNGSSGCILVFDLSKLESYDNLKYWHNDVVENLKEDIPIVLVGNKSDVGR